MSDDGDCARCGESLNPAHKPVGVCHDCIEQAAQRSDVAEWVGGLKEVFKNE